MPMTEVELRILWIWTQYIKHQINGTEAKYFCHCIWF